MINRRNLIKLGAGTFVAGNVTATYAEEKKIKTIPQYYFFFLVVALVILRLLTPYHLPLLIGGP